MMLTINVTKEDIQKARTERELFDKKKSWFYIRAKSCPIGQSIKRLDNFGEFAVFDKYIRVYSDTSRRDISLPDEAIRFIEKADKSHDRVKPIKFVVEV